MSFITVSHLGKRHQQDSTDVQALQELDMQVSEGERIAIVGPSGCGKTTLLRIVAGLIPPSSGDISVAGIAPSRYLSQGHISFVFQKPLLFPWRTVIENVVLPTEVGRSSPDDLQRAQELLKVLGLFEFQGVYPHQLSGGMLQRASLARALMVRPKLLLLDEPFSALDEITRERLWFDLAEIWERESFTMILVTHSVREAVFFANRVLLMSPRPGHIHKEIEIRWAGLRDSEAVSSGRFVELCEKVRAELS